MKKLSIICLTVLSVVFLVSCRQDEPGNANVASSTVTIHDYDWEWIRLFTDGGNHERGQYYVTIDYPAINNNVFNDGAVLVYMDVEGLWSQVPLTYYYYAFGEDESVYYYEASIEVATLAPDDVTHAPGGLRLFWTEGDYWNVRPDTHDFKIVVIEASAYDHRTDVDYSDYNAVKTAFQLAD